MQMGENKDIRCPLPMVREDVCQLCCRGSQCGSRDARIPLLLRPRTRYYVGAACGLMILVLVSNMERHFNITPSMEWTSGVNEQRQPTPARLNTPAARSLSV